MCVFTLPTASIDLVLIGLHTSSGAPTKLKYERLLFTCAAYINVASPPPTLTPPGPHFFPCCMPAFRLGRARPRLTSR